MIVLWKHNEKDEWINADIDELIEAYESIVRCKDCEYLGVKDFAYGYCKKRVTGIVMPNDFCSWAKMKGEK